MFLGASTPSTAARSSHPRRVGVDALLWGNDFPHPEGTWPHTRQSIRDAFVDVPQNEARRMLGENAAGLYRFDTDKLAGLAERIGPTVEDVHAEVHAEAAAGPLSR